MARRERLVEPPTGPPFTVTSNDFEGSSVRLRAVEPEDWEAFNAFDADTEMTRLSSSAHLPASRASLRKWAEEAAKRPDSDEVTLAIETLDGTVIGSLRVGHVDRRHRVFGYGLAIAADYCRKGYGSEAVRLLLRFYFGELGYQKAEVGVYAFNEASVRFHESLGFQHEGRRRRSHFSGGAFHDVILLGLTAEEFQSGRE